MIEPPTDRSDILTQQWLDVLFHAILVILERQCIDRLPGGKYWNTNDNNNQWRKMFYLLTKCQIVVLVRLIY